MAAEHVCPSSIRTDDVIWIQMGHLTQQLSSSDTSDSAAGGNDPQEAMELVMNGKQIEIPLREIFSFFFTLLLFSSHRLEKVESGLIGG